VTLITLGVKDLARSRAFYEKLGFKASDRGNESIVFMRVAPGVALGLYGWDALAEDAMVAPESSGFRGVTIAHNVRAKEEVAEVLNEAVAAGATLVKAGEDVFWGGHSGYFADPDGHLWEVAWNPYTPDGTFDIPA
ncbi:MAG: VOC family protein, partial [Hyphomonadaceae bacterium]